MSKDMLQELTLNGVRWATNILTEILSQYADKVSVAG